MYHEIETDTAIIDHSTGDSCLGSICVKSVWEMSELHCIADVKPRSVIEQKAKSELSSSLFETPWRMPLCNYVETCLLVLAYVDGVCVVKACAEIAFIAFIGCFVCIAWLHWLVNFIIYSISTLAGTKVERFTASLESSNTLRGAHLPKRGPAGLVIILVKNGS